jgi:SnoaL-like protein
MKLDPSKTWRLVEARLAREQNPRRRRNLETVLAHMHAEADGDLDRLMATVSDAPIYHAYASDDPIFSPRGKDEVRRFYQNFVASGAHRLEFDVDRLIVDDDCILTEGTMRIAYPGTLLKFMGHAVDDPDAFYLFQTRMAVVWPMDEHGLVIGEDTYTAGDGFAGITERKLLPEDIAA